MQTEAPIKRTRRTKQQIEATVKYWSAVASQDNYLGSVFVTEAGKIEYTLRVMDARLECEAVGVQLY